MSVDFVGQEPTMEFRVKRYADATFSDLGKEGLSPEEKRARLFELIEQYKDAEI
ncbi:MAG: hypothetical protein LBU27_08910 [Candidatus Peribacteria bacterium]|jgi:hypothetical protein|nr:hypothetical protein [Candidatus Peribacteria bacterium]